MGAFRGLLAAGVCFAGSVAAAKYGWPVVGRQMRTWSEMSALVSVVGLGSSEAVRSAAWQTLSDAKNSPREQLGRLSPQTLATLDQVTDESQRQVAQIGSSVVSGVSNAVSSIAQKFERFPVGTVVVIDGLRNNTSLNGRLGRIVGPQELGRYPVKILSEKVQVGIHGQSHDDDRPKKVK